MLLILYLLVSANLYVAADANSEVRARRQDNDEVVAEEEQEIAFPFDEDEDDDHHKQKVFLAKKKTYFEKHGEEYMVLSIFTGICLSIFIFGPIIVTFFKFKEAALLRVCIMITAFSYWIFWCVVYIAQLNPILGPRIGNATLLWMSRTWGRIITEESMLDEDRSQEFRETFADSEEAALNP